MHKTNLAAHGIALRCLLALLLAAGVLLGCLAHEPTRAYAATCTVYNQGGRTLSDALGITREQYVNYLESHLNDNYYLGTPYGFGDYRNPNGDHGGKNGSYDTAGVAAMNCTGFVWHTLYKASGMDYQTAYNTIPCWAGAGCGGWATWLRDNNIQYETIAGDSWEDVAEVLMKRANEGGLDKGDIVWTWDLSGGGVGPNGYPTGTSGNHHIGVCMSTTAGFNDGDPDTWWHSSHGSFFYFAPGHVWTEGTMEQNIISALTPKTYTSPFAATIVKFSNVPYNQEGQISIRKLPTVSLSICTPTGTVLPDSTFTGYTL